jgi:heat shock protein HtpX
MFKRFSLFLLTNILVIAMVSLVTSLLGIQGYLTSQGINYTALAIFCALWGTGGAIVSLLLSKFMAKKMMGVRVIDVEQMGPSERHLVGMVHRLAERAGLSGMPEVGVYDSQEVNAFATGPFRNSSLVAVSTGLLANMSEDEVEGVLGHEVTHVANGDMVTMTLIQGVINAFAMFFSRIVAYVISSALSSRDEGGGGMSYVIFFMLSIVFDIFFTFLGSFVTAAFSRWREFRADAGGARLAGRQKMIAALQRLQATSEVEDKRGPSIATLKISHRGGIMALLSTHPSLDIRIERLTSGGY